MKSWIVKLFCCVPLLSVGIVSGAWAQEQPCGQFFYNQLKPVVTEANEQKDTAFLCHSGYANLYSGVVLDPLWSADVLTAQSVRQGRGIGRHGMFHAESQLPPSMIRVYPNDYHSPRGEYWDRGHMVPNGDMPTPALQEETFSMANVVPQDADNNERLHEGIESTTRHMAQRYGKIYVVTGPVFAGAKLLRLNNKAFIPTMIFKAIYIPGKGGAAYLENNMAGMEYAVISLNQLKALAHIDVFPGLSEDEKNNAITLPVPHPTMRGPSREGKAKGFVDGKPHLVSLQTLQERKSDVLSPQQAMALGLLPLAAERAFEHPRRDGYEDRYDDEDRDFDGRRYRHHRRHRRYHERYSDRWDEEEY